MGKRSVVASALSALALFAGGLAGTSAAQAAVGDSIEQWASTASGESGFVGVIDGLQANAAGMVGPSDTPCVMAPAGYASTVWYTDNTASRVTTLKFAKAVNGGATIKIYIPYDLTLSATVQVRLGDSGTTTNVATPSFFELSCEEGDESTPSIYTINVSESVAKFDQVLIVTSAAMAFDAIQVSGTEAATGTAPSLIAEAPATTATVGTTYNYTFVASGTTPITYAVASGTLPPGLALNGTTGKLTGKPTTAGSYTFTISATNGSGTDTTASVTITVAEPEEEEPVVTKPGKVTGLAVAYAKGKVTFTWKAPVSDGGKKLTGYEYCTSKCTKASSWKSVKKLTLTINANKGASGTFQIRATNGLDGLAVVKDWKQTK